MDRMARRIAQLLNQARRSSNALSLTVVAFDLVDAVAGAMARHEHGETARISFDRPHAAVCVRGDPERIAHVLENLLDNTRKYSAADSPIEISLTVQGAEAPLQVADHGIGVPDDERASLFTPFYPNVEDTPLSGTGLGLDISQQLAKRHGGRVSLEASSDGGSVFALPLAKEMGARRYVRHASRGRGRMGFTEPRIPVLRVRHANWSWRGDAGRVATQSNPA